MQAGAELARHLAVHCPAPQLATIGPPLLSGLVKVLRHESLPNGLRPEQPEAVSMRAFSYGAVATLCARAPALLRSDLALVAMLFRALPSEDAGARTALQEALAALAAVHAPAAAAAAAPLGSAGLTGHQCDAVGMAVGTGIESGAGMPGGWVGSTVRQSRPGRARSAERGGRGR